MEIRILVQHNVGITAWRHLSLPSKWESCNYGRLSLCDPSIASIQGWMTQPALGGKCWMDRQSSQWSRNSRQSGNQKRMRQFIPRVMTSARSTSEDVPLIDQLKTELESLQHEASQARTRYESSRARFMRLAQVADQFQQRAVVDLKLGNEGNARQLLVEKKKVMTAADVSKRRSQLYELLFIKLSEAISQKETQLLAALSSVPAKVTINEEPTVRVISPRESIPVSFEEVLEHELEKILSVGVDDQPSLGATEKEDGGRTSSPSLEVVERAQRNCDTTKRPEESFAPNSFMGHGVTHARKQNSDGGETASSRIVWTENYRSEPLGQDTYSATKVESPLWEEMEIAAKDLERDVLSLQEESETLSSQLESILFSDDEDENTKSRFRDEVEGAPGTIDERTENPDVETERKMSINTGNEESQTDQHETETKMGIINNGYEEFETDKDEKIVTKVDVRLLFEEYLLDMDSQVAGLESKLQSFLVTADILLGTNSMTNDERVVLVSDLLQQVQSLRTRILDGVNMSIRQQSQET